MGVFPLMLSTVLLISQDCFIRNQIRFADAIKALEIASSAMCLFEML